MANGNKLEKICIIFLFLILILLFFVTPNINTDINVGNLIINEVMLINNNTIKDKYGKYSDYIELYNGNDYDVNLYGYYLTDSMKDTKKWAFPDVTIKKGEYLVVFASGKNNVIEGEIHTNFKLDSKGETVALFNSSSKILSKVYVKESLCDTSYGFNGEKYVYYYLGTPGSVNNSSYTDDIIYELKNDYKIRINEYMLNNKNLIKAKDNKYYSMVELYNYGSSSVSLNGFYLSNDINNLTKYTFPDITIKSNDYVVLYLSGKDKIEDDEIHTNFTVNNDEGVLVLSSPNNEVIDKVNIHKMDNNLSYGYYHDKWYLYSNPSFNKENTNNFSNSEIKKNIIINEVSIYPKEALELKNISDEDFSLTNYSIGDKSGVKTSLKNYSIKKNGYLVLDKSKLKFSINTLDEEIYLYHNEEIIDTFKVHKLVGNISTGIDDNGSKVYYKNITLGSSNHSTSYNGISSVVKYSIDGGYVSLNQEIKLECDGNVYYTTDGSFPTNKSTKYDKPIKISKNMVIKTICYKDKMIESDVTSRTFIIDKPHNLPVVSLSTQSNNLFGSGGLFSNYTSNSEKKASFEFYENDGTYGTSFISDIKLSGMDSRREPQKSISVYLRKKYGMSKVYYPFFDVDYASFSSILLRNAGEDPMGVRIQDATLTRILKGQMDIDMQEYRPVVVYINGSYYGMYNLREKLNGDFVESKFNINKDNIDLIKYNTPTKGNTKDYNQLVNYIKSHDVSKSEVYEYLKTKIDMQELINYWIVESFYGNTDLGNIRYWKDDTGKWRWMLYDLDWSLWNANIDMGYPIKNIKVPAATYLPSSITIVRNLYKNSEFKNLYLKSVSYHMKNTFNKERMIKIVDELKDEIKDEMPLHIKRWGSSYARLNSMSRWENNISSFKKRLTNRYDKVINNLRSYFNLSDSEYKKYFGDIK